MTFRYVDALLGRAIRAHKSNRDRHKYVVQVRHQWPKKWEARA